MREIGRRLGSGKEADVYEYGEAALKLYRRGSAKAAAFREASNLAILEPLAVPTPRIHAVGEYDDRWGLLMDRAQGPSFAEQMKSEAPTAYIEQLARLHLRIHAQPGTGLPSLKARLATNIQRIGHLSPDSRDRLLRQLDHLPDGNRLCHGDFHPWNVVGSGDGAMILDWLDACSGAPEADVCRSYVLIHHVDPVTAAEYVDTYVRLGGADASAINAWLAPVAAARLAEGVPAETDELLKLAGLDA